MYFFGKPAFFSKLEKIYLLICLVIDAKTTLIMAEQGDIIKLHPPMNKGQHNGSGMIVTLTGEAHVFHTPGDNNSVDLAEGQTVNFTLNSNGKIDSVTTGLVIPPGDGG